MSRSASILGNVFWIAITVATLLYPCLPARDPNDEFFSLSRFDFALLYLASPETLWLQWTAGLPIEFWSVRFESIVIALVWLGACGCMGVSLVGVPRRDVLRGCESWIFQWGFRLALGYGCFQGVFLFQAFVLQHVTFLWTSIGMLALAVGFFVVRTRYWIDEAVPFEDGRDKLEKPEEDRSLDQAWKRRLFGVATISCVVLAILHVVGSLVPSVDMQVRKEKWNSSVHYHEQNNAPKGSISKPIGSSKSFTRAAIGRSDAFVIATLDVLQIDVRSSMNSSMSSTQGGVAASYPTLLASKLILIVVGFAGLLMLWETAIGIWGRLPATMMLLLLLSTPSLLELGKLGRMEWIATTQFAAILAVLVRRGESLKIPKWTSVLMLTLPMGEWGWSLGFQPGIAEFDRLGTILRFLGFSTLFTIPWVGCIVIGVVTKPTRMHLLLLSIGGGGFAIAGLAWNLPDRSWIPLLSLFTLPVAGGIAWLLEHQNRFVGLTVWFGIMVTSLINAAYWPMMENRILAPVEWLVVEGWMEYGESPEDVRFRYPLEFRKQIVEGKLRPDSKIVLFGTRDDLDIPVSCVALTAPNFREKESIWELIQQIEATHIGVVSNRDWEGSERDGFEIDQANALRVFLEKLVAQGELAKIPVSAECFDLTLFEVVR